MWRKQKACTQCRKNKVRCEYSDPNLNTCTRCAKRDLKCEITLRGEDDGDGGDRTKKRPRFDSTANNNGIGGQKYSWIEKVRLKSNPVSTHEQRLEKMAQLEHVMLEARQEIDKLKMESEAVYGAAVTAPAPAPTSVAPPVPPVEPAAAMAAISQGAVDNFRPKMSEDVIRSRHYVQTAIEMGLFSQKQAEDMYDTFMKHLKIYCPFDIDETLSMEKSAAQLPLTTFCMIYSVGCCSNVWPSEHNDEMSHFLDRVIAYRVYVELDLNYDVIYCVVLRVLFIWRLPEKGTLIDLFVGITAVGTMDLATMDDVKAIYHEKGEKWEQSRLNIQAYLAYYLCQTSLAITGSRSRIFSLLPEPNIYLEAFSTTQNERDLMVVFNAKANLITHEAVENISIRRHMSPIAVRENVKHYIKRLRDVMSLSQLSAEKRSQIEVKRMFATTLNQLELTIYESALNQMIFNNQDKVDISELWMFLRGILTATHNLIDGFLEFTSNTCFYPRFYYFRPLHAITSLLRIRMLLWSHGQDSSEFKVVEQLERVKTAWQDVNTRSNSAKKVYPLLLRVESWVRSLESPMHTGRCVLEENGLNGLKGPATSSTLVHNLVRDFINAEQPERQTQYFSFENINPESSQNPEEIEQILKELFSEVM